MVIILQLASGNNSYALGASASASGDNSIALGAQAYAENSSTIAIGSQSRALNNNSTAIGNNSKATGGYSTTIGHYSTASGDYSLAGGYNAIASGTNSVAFTYNTEASGSSSFAVGAHNVAAGNSSVSIGLQNKANGNYSLAFGTSVVLNSDYSLGFGHNVTVNHSGATLFQCADTSGISLTSNNSNEFATRFSGGYRLFSNKMLTSGVALISGASSWSSLSDRRLKENIKPITNGLDKIMKLNPVSYNYLHSDVQSLGLIAQEVKEVVPEIVNVPKNEDEYMSVRYSELIPVLIDAVQELKKENEELKKKMESLTK